MKTIDLEIITPDKQAFTDKVNMINAPSTSGVIGILPDHVPLFTKLVEGEIKITKNEDEIYFAIGGGFLEIINNRAEILVTSAYRAEELNESELLEAKKRAEKALEQKPIGEALALAETQFRRSTIALKVLRRKRSSIS